MTALTAFLGKAAFGKQRGPEVEFPLQEQMVGLELEVDRDSGKASATVFPVNYMPQWQQKRDGSLSNGYEYVLATPLAGQDLADAVHQLFSGDTKVFRTYTGSTHIHLNMLDGTTLENLQALALLTYAMEGLLYYVGDNSRQWCGYANRMTGAPHAVLENILGPSVARTGLRRALNNAGRYYGLNLAALDKYGTVEFRYFPTATSAEEMLSWVKLVQQIKKAACDMGSVKNVLDTLSDKSKYNDFVSTYLSEHAEAVEASCPYGKVKILANKALVIANVARTGSATWNKQVLSDVFFKAPKLASVAPRAIVPVNAHYADYSQGWGNRHISARQGMETARENGKDCVLLNYEGSLYYAWAFGDRLDWMPLRDMAIENPELFNRYIAFAESVGVPPLAIEASKYSGSRAHKIAARHGRFVPFSAGQDTQTADEDYDDYAEPSEDNYDDEDEDY